jgi:DNA-binding response OmpR family regulator
MMTGISLSRAMPGPASIGSSDAYRSRLFRLVCNIVAQGSRQPDDPSDATRSRLIAIPESSVLDLFTAVIDGRATDTDMLSDDSEGETFVAGDVEINPAFREVTKSGRPVHLTPREYDLLLALARRGGIPVTRARLEQDVWQTNLTPRSRTLDQHIVELRRKLEDDPKKPRYILTTRKFGFRCVGSWSGRK